MKTKTKKVIGYAILIASLLLLITITDKVKEDHSSLIQQTENFYDLNMLYQNLKENADCIEFDSIQSAKILDKEMEIKHKTGMFEARSIPEKKSLAMILIYVSIWGLLISGKLIRKG